VRLGKKSFFISTVVVLLGYGVWSFSSSPVQDYSQPAVSSDLFPLERHLDIEFKVQNKTQRKLDNAELRFTLPASPTSKQWVKDVSSSTPLQILPDMIGNQVAYFRFDPLLPKDDLAIRIDIDLRLAETEVRQTAEDVANYLSNDAILDISNPKIQTLASQLLDDNAEKSINNILGWLKDNKKILKSPGADGTKFVRPQVEQGAIDDVAASEMLSKKGYREQDALYLLVALTRAIKLPSRVVVGLKIDDKSKAVYTFDDLIVYPEVLLDKAWRTIDLGDFKLTKTPGSLALRRLEVMPARLEIMQPYRLLIESVGVEFISGSVKYRFSPS
jgi:transglutaminase-like putative cysteine protease